ncbi:hypothetical protein JB92DRAFT_2892419 [Gautieria morchelliformis]|nr:hypothetical protein JB92DRAFT_2892419 [Gautieria morchelliformis]
MSGQSYAQRPMPMDSGVPSKRRKLEHATDAPKELPAKDISVKRELSPTPPPSLAPRTAGTIRIDIPRSCLKTELGWKDRRDKWVTEETLKLRALGLKVDKRIIREDGLALDWVSPVPVCPLTLKPINSVPPSAQALQPQHVPGKQAYADPLGHALRDQTISARVSNVLKPNAPVHTQTHVPKEKGREYAPPMPDDDPGVTSNFVVVGAATRKEPEGPSSERAAESAPDEVQWEHRKLLPPDLRPSTQFRRGSREAAKDRKSRRLAWITKEIEKVEGYTGEKVGSFKYDGDHVIIYLSKAVYYARRRDEQARDLPERPAQLDHGQAHDSHASSTVSRSEPTLIPSHSAKASQKSRVKNPVPLHPQISVKLGSSTASANASTTAANAQLPHSSSHMAPNALSSNEPTSSAAASRNRTSTVVESAVGNSEVAIQARGLGFLERYLQLFDSNRGALVLAYTPNATFAFTEETISGQSSQVLKTGRFEIVETLKTLGPDQHHSPLADIAYNIATLGDMSPGGLLLTCEGALIPVDRPIHQQEHQYFSRIFVLKQNDGASRQTWPVQIVAERLTIQKKAK